MPIQFVLKVRNFKESLNYIQNSDLIMLLLIYYMISLSTHFRKLLSCILIILNVRVRYLLIYIKLDMYDTVQSYQAILNKATW